MASPAPPDVPRGRSATRPGAVGLIIAGLLALGTGWLVHSPTVPLYDGVGFPDEPYRYVHPGPGQQTRLPPSVARAVFTVTSGTNPDGEALVSDEFGPQVSLYVPAGSLQQPDGGGPTVVMTAEPTAPDTEVPANGKVTGDVYRLAAMDGGTPAAMIAATGTITPCGPPVGFRVIPVIDYRPGPGRPWQLLQTSKVGNDIFEAPLKALGDYATILPTHGPSAVNGHTPVIVLVVVLGLMAVVILVVRGLRTISEDQFPDDSDDRVDG